MNKLYAIAFASLLPFGLYSNVASGLAIGADFVGDYTATDLGSIAGLPSAYGGMVFKAGDPDTVLIGGAANTAAGLYYEVPLIRDIDDNIIAFGAPSAFGSVGEFNDGGIAYGPGGVLFTAQWSVNMLGQTKPGSADEDKIIDLTPLGIATDVSISGLNFVPAGFSGAGKFKAVSWAGGRSCLTLYQTCRAPQMMNTSHTRTRMWGQVMNRFWDFSSPVMYSAA